MNDYDIAVLGGGLAGLSVLYHLHRAGKLAGKRIALVDPERKTEHDRTWSFWERGEGPFEDQVYHRWQQVSLANSRKDYTCDLRPYAYKVVMSNDFYAHVNKVLDGVAGLQRIEQRVSGLQNSGSGARWRRTGGASRATPP